MRAFIGSKLIATLKPRDKQYDIRDSKLAGFLIRVNPSGKMTYVCQYARGRRINLGTVGVITPMQARDKALAILNDAANEIYPNDPEKLGAKISLQSFMKDHYSPWFLAHRKSGQKTIDHINRCFVRPYGNLSLTEFTSSLVDKWRTQRIKDGAAIETVNRDLATFKAAIAKAVLWGLIKEHPLEKLKLLKSDRSGKIRYLTPDEENNLRDATIKREERIKSGRESGNEWRKERSNKLLPDLNHLTFTDHLRPMILLSINTGMRRGELFSLKWENVNFEQALLTIEGSYAKSGKTRHIPLNTEALRTLKVWRKQTNTIDLVFPSKDGKRFDTVKTGWSSILELAGIKNFRWHDMRHHFASKLVMAGVDLNTVRELLGHAEMTMTLRYAHLAPEHKAQAVQKLVDHRIKELQNG
jgi:integrase